MRKKKSNETRVLAGRQTPLCTCNHLRAVRLTKILQLTPLHQTTPPPLSFSSLLSLYVDRTLMFVQWKLTFFVLLTALPLSVCLFFFCLSFFSSSSFREESLARDQRRTLIGPLWPPQRGVGLWRGSSRRTWPRSRGQAVQMGPPPSSPLPPPHTRGQRLKYPSVCFL